MLFWFVRAPSSSIRRSLKQLSMFTYRSSISVPSLLRNATQICENVPIAAGEFWSHWLQYLAFFTIFRNFFFIPFFIAAIKFNVVEWREDSKLNFGKFFCNAGLIFTLIPAPEKKGGGKISMMAPFHLDEFLPENAFFDFKKVYILIWASIRL